MELDWSTEYLGRTVLYMYNGALKGRNNNCLAAREFHGILRIIRSWLPIDCFDSSRVEFELPMLEVGVRVPVKAAYIMKDWRIYNFFIFCPACEVN